MKTSKQNYPLDFDINKAYENIREASKSIEKEQNEQERDFLFKTLKQIIDGREIIVENSMSLR